MDGTPDLARLRAGFGDPDQDAAPMVRWWWFGPAVQRATLVRELDTMRAAGYGGVEVAFVYPLSAETDRFASDTFLADLRFAAEQARERGMRFDLTLGSGWSFGGPHIDETTAARGIHWERHEVGLAPARIPVLPAWPGDQLIAAYIGDGSVQETPRELARLQTSDGHLVVPAGRGPRVVLVAISRLTGQSVKRAAAGAEGPVLDHYSAAATDAHIAAVCDPLLDAVPAELIGSAFCDSLEVYQADWTPALVEEFTTRRGYDPLEELWMLSVSAPEAARFRDDYYRTLSELYEESFLARLRRWAARRGVPFRIQSYGEPPATVSSFRHADRIEGEGWGWTEITQTRWASSAAQLYGRSVVSAEAWTWVHSPSFRATPLDLAGEVHEHLLLGINHIIGHGWPYHEQGDDGLGWIFYAAGALDERNPWWPAMPPLARYVQRLSWLFRQGSRLTDVAIYAPYSDVRARTDASLNLWAGVRAHVGDEIPATIRRAGYDFDLIDDDALASLDPRRFGVVILPEVTRLPEPSRGWLQRVAAAGGRVLRVGGGVSIGDETSADGVAAALSAATPPPLVAVEGTSWPGAVGVIQRRVGGTDVYLVANTGPRPERVVARLRTPRDAVERWDADTGEVRASGDGRAPVELSLHPYEAAVLVAFDGEPHRAGPAAPAPTGVVHLDDWSVAYADQTTPRQVALPHRWEDDPARAGYSGSATYTTVVEIDAADPGAVLDLGAARPIEAGSTAGATLGGRSYRVEVTGPVGEIAVVAVNDAPAGVLWKPPYELPVGHLLRPGPNTITLTVHNTAANALAHDTGIREAADLSRSLYGQRFRLQDLERAAETVSSGLLAIPRILSRG